MSYSIKELELPLVERDKSELVNLHKNNDGVETESWIYWLFESEFAKKNIFTYLLLYKNKIVGYASIILKIDRELKLGYLVNLLVDKKHRTLGPGINLHKAIINDIKERQLCDLCFGLPNKSASMIFRRRGYHPFNVTRRFIYIINPFGYLHIGGFLKYFFEIIFRTLFLFVFRIKIITNQLKNPYCKIIEVNISNDFPHSTDIPEAVKWRYVETYKHHYKFCIFDFDSNKERKTFIVFHFDEDILVIDEIIGVKRSCYESVLLNFIYKALGMYKFRSIIFTSVSNRSFNYLLNDIGFLERYDDKRNSYLLKVNSDVSDKLISEISYCMSDSEIDI
jgi:hypothetical protein